MKEVQRMMWVVAICCSLFGCLVMNGSRITPDPVVDGRLEGVWQRTPKKADEVGSDRDRDDLGVQNYLIFGEAGKRTDRLKAIAIDHIDEDEESGKMEKVVATRKHRGRNLLLVQVESGAPSEKAPAKESQVVFDYEFNSKGELFLRFWSIDDLGEMLREHPLEVTRGPEEDFSPAFLQGDEEALLDFYTDPKVRKFLTSCGKYRRLEAATER